MGDIVGIASEILSASQQRLEITAHNVANARTAGFKRQAVFADMLIGGEARADSVSGDGRRTDFTPGALSESGNPFDLALSGPGFFQLRAGEQTFYSRNGQFSLTEAGRLQTAGGFVLQQQGGGDLILAGREATFLEDGIVLELGRPVARVGVYRAADPGAMTAWGGAYFTAPDDVMNADSAPMVRQGMVEAANVVLADEMVGMMEAIRQAEIGARMVQTYDTLMGQVISTFGRRA